MLEKLLTRERIVAGLYATNKIEAIQIAVKQMLSVDADLITKLIIEREARKSYAYGKGIAIIHLINDRIQNLTVSIITCSPAIDWDAADKKHVSIIGVVLSPSRGMDDYINVIKEVSKALANENLRFSIVNMDTEDQILAVIKNMKDTYA